MVNKKGDGWKDIVIFLLFVILIGLICLLIYSFKFNKTRYNDDITTTKTLEERTSEVTLNGVKHNIKIVEEKDNYLNVYYDDVVIKSVIKGDIDNKRNSIDILTSVDNINYLLINFPSNNVDKPVILDDTGKIIYEFSEFKYYSEYNYFIDDQGNKNFYISDNSIIFYSELSAENQITYSKNEYATLGIITINSGNVNIEYPRIEHGILS